MGFGWLVAVDEESEDFAQYKAIVRRIDTVARRWYNTAS